MEYRTFDQRFHDNLHERLARGNITMERTNALLRQFVRTGDMRYLLEADLCVSQANAHYNEALRLIGEHESGVIRDGSSH